MIQNMAEQVSTGEGKELTRGQRLWLELVHRRRTEPISLERAKLLTASWKETEGLPVPIRRARAFEKVMTEIPVFIHDEQLIAGNYGSRPMAAGMARGDNRRMGAQAFRSRSGHDEDQEEDIPVMREIAEYWKDKAIDSCFFRYIGPEEEKRYRDLDYLVSLSAISIRNRFTVRDGSCRITRRSSGKDCWEF